LYFSVTILWESFQEIINGNSKEKYQKNFSDSDDFGIGKVVEEFFEMGRKIEFGAFGIDLSISGMSSRGSGELNKRQIGRQLKSIKRIFHCKFSCIFK
jgi:hypothetical protein